MALGSFPGEVLVSFPPKMSPLVIFFSSPDPAYMDQIPGGSGKPGSLEGFGECISEERERQMGLLTGVRLFSPAPIARGWKGLWCPSC
jgi:hypothetical protein